MQRSDLIALGALSVVALAVAGCGAHLIARLVNPAKSIFHTGRSRVPDVLAAMIVLPGAITLFCAYVVQLYKRYHTVNI